VTLLLVVVGIAIVAGVAVLVARDRPVLEADAVDPRALRWPPDGPVTPASLAEARFTVALRGYRMDEVDRVLDDARAALVERDRRGAELEARLGIAGPGGPDPSGGPDALSGPDALRGPLPAPAPGDPR
jgi:DivIVA domain-containing protein